MVCARPPTTVPGASHSRRTRMRRRRLILLTTPVLAAWMAACASVPRKERPLDRINHVIVIYQENWSFDGLFGKFPGANGIANAGPAVKQVDKDGKPYATLPQPIDTTLRPPGPDPRFPADMPVAPF